MSLGPEQIINAIWANTQENVYQLSSSGKSGALFYYTKDKNYMLKSISKREFQSLLRILKDYLNFLDSHPDSLLVKFFGAYKLRWKSPEDTKCFCMKMQTTSYIVVMDNIFKNFDVGLRFDLKGSTRSRTRLEED